MVVWWCGGVVARWRGGVARGGVVVCSRVAACGVPRVVSVHTGRLGPTFGVRGGWADRVEKVLELDVAALDGPVEGPQLERGGRGHPEALRMDGLMSHGRWAGHRWIEPSLGGCLGGWMHES